MPATQTQFEVSLPKRRSKRKGKVQDKEVEMYVALYLEGYEPSEIDEQFGRTPGTCWSHLDAMGYKGRYRTVTEKMVERFVSYYVKDRRSLAWISSKTGHSSGTITRHLLRKHVRIRHPGHRGKRGQTRTH